MRLFFTLFCQRLFSHFFAMNSWNKIKKLPGSKKKYFREQNTLNRRSMGVGWGPKNHVVTTVTLFEKSFAGYFLTPQRRKIHQFRHIRLLWGGSNFFHPVFFSRKPHFLEVFSRFFVQNNRCFFLFIFF